MKFTVKIEISNSMCEAMVTHGRKENHIPAVSVVDMFDQIRRYIQQELDKKDIASD